MGHSTYIVRLERRERRQGHETRSVVAASKPIEQVRVPAWRLVVHLLAAQAGADRMAIQFKLNVRSVAVDVPADTQLL